mmetsp:Transcript_39633/g.83339  ORF Transcript_39633/g.83339 Transcript_39633/m.83339 type:complete len:203 (-) Transcript_39633:1104-1712(-)
MHPRKSRTNEAPRNGHGTAQPLLDRLRQPPRRGIRLRHHRPGEQLSHPQRHADRDAARGRAASGPHHQLVILQHQHGEDRGHDREGIARSATRRRGHAVETPHHVAGRSFACPTLCAFRGAVAVRYIPEIVERRQRRQRERRVGTEGVPRAHRERGEFDVAESASGTGVGIAREFGFDQYGLSQAYGDEAAKEAAATTRGIR